MTFTDDLITQLTTLPDVASIDIQTEIQWFMRPYLLDFLIEAHAAFSLLPETLFLAVNILDRYCSKRVVYRRHYQLVGCTALLIAAKYGECAKKVPHIRELANMCCQLYDEDMFVQMEKHVIVTLDWLVGAPTADSFLEIILDDGMCDAEMEHLARYILEIAMFHKEFVSKRPSDMAKASLALSRVILNRPQAIPGSWATGYDSLTLVSLSQQLHRPSQILIQKYKSPHLSRVSMVLETFLAHHANISRHYAAPPTPPGDVPSPGSDKHSVNAGSYCTPQKSQYPANMPHGCLTPPITPDIESFAGYNPEVQARKYPTTPTPLTRQPADEQRPSFYVPSEPVF